MSGTENSPTVTLDERLRLGAGFAAADRPRILGALSALAPHLSGWEHDQVDLDVSLKDTEGPDQKVTLQAWLAGRAHLVATSHERDLDQQRPSLNLGISTRAIARDQPVGRCHCDSVCPAEHSLMGRPLTGTCSTSKHMLSAGRSLEGLLRWERR